MQTQAPDEGPSSGGPSASAVNQGGETITPNAAVKERHDPKALRDIAQKYAIDSTKSLVAAYNAATDDERAVLLGWLNKYDERSDECLKPMTVLEYAELASIVSRSTQDDDILRNLMYAICSCICQQNFYKPNFAIALCRALRMANPSVYGGAAQLIVITNNLLSSISPEPRITSENFAQSEVTFRALHQTLLLLSEFNQNGIYEKEKRKLRRAVAEKERAMELSCKYYPVSFHFKTLRQAVERLETKEASSHLAHAVQHVGCGLCGLLYVFHCVRNLARCDIDPAALQEAYTRAQTVIVDMGTSRRPWFDTFKNLMTARQEASKDETKIGLFETKYGAAMEHQRNMKNKEDLKALRYGIVRESGTLALEGLSENVRNLATVKLMDLAMHQAVNEGWTGDVDILIALLDVTCGLHGIGQGNEDDTKNVVLSLHQTCEHFAKGALTQWLGGSSIEDKLAARCPQKLDIESKDLCIKVGREVGYIPLAVMNSKAEELKKRYLHKDFATVISWFEEGSPKHVKDMKHHVVISEEVIEERRFESREGAEKVIQGMEEIKGESSNRRRDQAKEYYEKKTRVTKPIALEDLFKPRSLKSGDPESEVRKVLLYGNPGSGKTCITKVVAHRWASGEMAQDLNAVYVVPVRVLNRGEYNGQKWTRLEGAISQICFAGSGHAFDHEDLVSQVEHDLDDPSTMLMVDGLDEANDLAMELLSSVWERSCKVLLLSRPYNMRNVETRVDVQVECLGFNDQQLREYVEGELSEEEAPRLIRSLENSSAMWEMAHIPVTAHILCSLSKEHNTAIEERGKRPSVFQVYNDMANYIWKRFKTKPAAAKVKRSDLFDDLERIAFESLRMGLILIPPRLVTRYATSTDAAGTFKESGLLLLVMEGQEYQFPHLTFQEYFAGRHIAKGLRNSGSAEEDRVLEFIREEKYNRKHDLTLSFAMHAYAEGRSKSALQGMLSIVDEDPIEVLGIQHFFLRLRALEATLEETDEGHLDDLPNDEQTVELAESARQLLERTIDDVLIREIVVKEFQQMSGVLEGFPQVLRKTVDEVKKTLACAHYLTWKEMAKITDVLKLARHSAKHSNALVQFVLQLVKTLDDWCSPEERFKRLSCVAEKMPKHAGEVLPTLAKGCVDEDGEVRRSAMEGIGSVVAAAPQHAGEVLPTLAKGCVDEDGEVRRSAMEGIGSVVAAAPQHAGEVLPTLAKGCVDEDSYVRRRAMEGIGKVVAAAPHHAGEVLPTLAKGCVDEDWGVRSRAMEAVGKVVAAAPQHAGEVLPTLAKGCVDEDSYVRYLAIEAIGSVVAAAPQHACEVLPTLAKGCVDEDREVRSHAMEGIGSIVAATPQHAGEVLPTLAKGCVDEHSSMRYLAIKAVGSVVAAAPQHAGEVLPTLAKGCVDEHSSMRYLAIKAVGSVVAAAPQHACEVLPTLAKGCVDEDSSVRYLALESIGKVVAAAPQHAGEVLPTLAKGCVDRWDVRSRAMEGIGKVAAAAPQHAGEVLPTLAKGCVDEHYEVRDIARRTLGKVNLKETISLATSFPSTFMRGLLFFFVRNSVTLGSLSKKSGTVPCILHTTFSQEIGRWSKEAVDVLIVHLKRECDKQFLGLLENICIKE